MRICCRPLQAALFALLLIEILMCSSLCQCHESLPRSERSIQYSRKLLVSTASISTSQNKINGAMKEPKKAVEPSLRKAPPSVPNPTQNK
ncbi:hypothetical protein I3760_09G030700 [Carya illinoinensis]|nr:hypothetical protein I3760_09G030700 [Carya illinoinensis]